MSNVDIALSYAAGGWRVFPVHSPGVGDRRCSCSNPQCTNAAKHPRTPRGLKDATTDESQIRSWWQRWPSANVGIATGADSGNVVLDVDPRHGGDESLAELEREHGALPATVEVHTGGGGRHLYFVYPGHKVSNRADLRPGLDVRGDGGYVVAPPSVHASGVPYEWVAGRGPQEIEIAAAPAWLLDLLTKRTAVSTLERAQKYCARAENVATGARNDAAFRLAGHLRAIVDDEHQRLGEDQILDLMRGWNARNTPPLEEHELATCIASSGKNGTPRPDKPPRDPARGSTVKEGMLERPTIDTRVDRLELQTAALNALRTKNDPEPRLFMRGGQLVRIDLNERQVPTIRAVEQAQLTDALMHAACFVGGRGEQTTPVDPPRTIVSSILGHGALPRYFPPLLSVTRTPVVRPDGSLFVTGGYDGVTELYFWSGDVVDLSGIPLAPTDAEIAAARETLRNDLLGEFPFATETDATNSVGLMLTPLVRPLIHGSVPGAALDAPQPRTGKTKIANLSSLVAAGHNAAITSAPKDDVEWKKCISSFVSAGASTVVFDNVVGPVDSASLASVITCPGEWVDRVFGKNDRTMSLPVRLNIVLTGNNLRLAGDLPHRFYKIRLNAKTARPDLRTFKHEDLEAWAQQERARLLRALLVLVRAWFARGKPEPVLPRWGGFEQWTRVVGGVLHVGGFEDFLANREEFLANADVEAAEQERLVRLCVATFGAKSFTSSQLVDVLAKSSADELAALPESVSEAKSEHRVRRVGIELKGILDRRYGADSVRIERASNDSHQNVARWKVARDA